MIVDYHKLLIECLELQKDATRENLAILVDLEKRIRKKIEEKEISNKSEEYIKIILHNLDYD